MTHETRGVTDEAAEKLLAVTPEMLRELEAAHRIIGCAYQLMTDEQKDELKRLVAIRELTGSEGSPTRYWERLDIIAKAEMIVKGSFCTGATTRS